MATYKAERGIKTEELKPRFVVRAGIEPGISDSKSGVLTTRPRGLILTVIVCFTAQFGKRIVFTFARREQLL